MKSLKFGSQPGKVQPANGTRSSRCSGRRGSRKPVFDSGTAAAFDSLGPRKNLRVREPACAARSRRVENHGAVTATRHAIDGSMKQRPSATPSPVEGASRLIRALAFSSPIGERPPSAYPMGHAWGVHFTKLSAARRPQLKRHTFKAAKTSPPSAHVRPACGARQDSNRTLTPRMPHPASFWPAIGTRLPFEPCATAFGNPFAVDARHTIG